MSDRSVSSMYTLRRVPPVEGLSDLAAHDVSESDPELSDATDIGAALAGLMRNPSTTFSGGTLSSPLGAFALSAGCGAVTCGVAGGAVGWATGMVLGGALGLAPSLLTLGFSIPLGTTLGGGVGLFTGLALGSGAGVVGGSAVGAAGIGAFAYREELKTGFVCVVTDVADVVTNSAILLFRVSAATASTGLGSVESVKGHVVGTVSRACDVSWPRSDSDVPCHGRQEDKEEEDRACDIDRSTRVTVVSAAAGAVAGGVTGGTAGTATGGLVGAALGVIPAFFTFGTSIPVGAALGGTLGFCAGTVAGSTAGLVSGGAAGYTGFMYKKQIRDRAASARRLAASSLDDLTMMARNSMSLCCDTGGTL
uniref:Uncharacterized protein n=1 Tax=Noctiluca scintillans TaxID=2966 RepID=A0A7S1EVX2_NOCSC